MDPHILVPTWAAAKAPDVAARLRELEVGHTMEEAADIGAAAAAALANGRSFLVVLGGDADLNAVVAALMNGAAPRVEGAAIGILPATPSGVARTFGIPDDPVLATRALLGDDYFDLDVGLAELGAPGPVVPFIAVAEVGFGARMAIATERLPRWLGRGRRFLGFWLGLAGSGDRLELRSGNRSFDGPAWDLVIGNGQFLGELRLSPRSFPGDGILDALVMTGTRSAAFRRLPQMYRGEHVPDDDVREFRGPDLAVATSRPVPVHVDGVPIGTTPVAFRVVPQALRLKI